MAVHTEVLRVAQALGRERGDWKFNVADVVRALAQLNEHSVRAHVASRCCVNAPANHPHRWPYFRRVGRGLYEVMPRYRSRRADRVRLAPERVAEEEVPYVRAARRAPRDTIHAVLRYEPPWYVAECLEVAVITQGRNADEVLRNLQEAVALHLEGEMPSLLGLGRNPRLVVTYEMSFAAHAATP